MKSILVTGALGQIGSELVAELRTKYGHDNVIATDLRDPRETLSVEPPYEQLDVLDRNRLWEVSKRYGIDTIYHLAAILSAVGEKKPDLAWDVNMRGLKNILDLGMERNMTRIMVPSSIAVFGPTTPVDDTPQETLLRPNSMYGVTKVAGELLCDYYWSKYKLDVRGVRYPGLISYKTPPGGGTTDYAVAIYVDAIKKGRYTCFVREDTVLPMMYMPDALKAIIDLAEADGETLRYRNAYNIAALSFDVAQLAESIQRHIPEFEVRYEPDFHQAIADSWPNTIDDTAARDDWHWQPNFDLDAMTDDMLANLRRMQDEGTLY
ncbi:NAD-dependent epimerase/dehydratase family protein [bacterium]|nr:NAD-dependent epimerase/dehydratase family protein [bacterium]